MGGDGAVGEGAAGADVTEDNSRHCRGSAWLWDAPILPQRSAPITDLSETCRFEQFMTEFSQRKTNKHW